MLANHLHFRYGVYQHKKVGEKVGENRGKFYIFTIQYPVPLFSLCTKSLIAVLKDANQLSEENGGGPFC